MILKPLKMLLLAELPFWVTLYFNPLISITIKTINNLFITHYNVVLSRYEDFI